MAKRNINYAEFTGLFLHKEEFGRTYQYDSNGNVTSTKNLSSEKSGATYDDYDNMLTYYQPGRTSSEQYTLDWGNTTAKKKQHLLRYTKSPHYIVSKTIYDADDTSNTDAKGLPLASVVQNNTDDAQRTIFMRTEMEYQNNNYVCRQKDARGKSVQTKTDPDCGTVTSVTDPLGHMVHYDYDEMKRTTCVEARELLCPRPNENDAASEADAQAATGEGCTVCNGAVCSEEQACCDACREGAANAECNNYRVLSRNTYRYEDDRLVEIMHNTEEISDVPEDTIDVDTPVDTNVHYHFTYDEAGRAKEVMVGLDVETAQVLSSNTYNPDGTLHKVTYGNDSTVAGQPKHSVTYQYDDFKRTTGIIFNDEAEPRYTYEYGANGQVASVTDEQLHRTASSEYDTANRPMRI